MPPQLDGLVAKATHPEPQARYESARSMARAIEALGRDTGWLATHSEVAEWVRELVSHDLGERRQAIVNAKERKAGRAELREAEPAASPPPIRSRKSVLGLAATGVLAATAVVAFLVLRGEAQTHATPANEGVGPSVVVSSSPPVPQATSSEQAPQNNTPKVEPAAEPSASVNPPLEGRARRTVRTPRKSSPAIETKARPKPLEAPDKVTTKNPYR